MLKHLPRVLDISIAMIKYPDQKQLIESLFWLMFQKEQEFITAPSSSHGDRDRKLRVTPSTTNRKQTGSKTRHKLPKPILSDGLPPSRTLPKSPEQCHKLETKYSNI